MEDSTDPPQQPSPVWRIARSVLTIYLALCALVFLFQRRLQYFPDPSAVRLPRGGLLQGLEEVKLRTDDDLEIFAWYWSGERPVTFVIFHGNGGNRLHRLEWMRALHLEGYGVFLLDYRGYGGSEGSPTEDGLYRDAEAAVRWLEDRNVDNLVYLGESLGSGVAVEMASRRPPAALIVQSGFSSAVDIGKSAYPYLPVGLLMRDRFESLAKIGEIQVPLLQIHGDQDRIVPLAFGRKLFEAAKEPKQWLTLSGLGHNTAYWAEEEYMATLEKFLSTHLKL